jgi:hypothetical protein
MEQVRPDVYPEPDAESIAGGDIVPTTQYADSPRSAHVIGSSPVVSLAPTIVSVHEPGHAALPNSARGLVRIRQSRFEVDVSGLNPVTRYRLLVFFDDEAIGESDWVGGRGSYTIPTKVGFPPGQYRLTVRAIEEGISDRAVQTPPVLVNYQPTYLRRMGQDGGHDITAVPVYRTNAHRGSDDGSHSREIEVRLHGLEGDKIYTFSDKAKWLESDPLVIPCRLSLAQGRTQQLMLSVDMGFADIEVYSTLRIPRTPARAAFFLAHNSVPLEITKDDIDHAADGRMLTKVVYLPYQSQSNGGRLVKTRTSQCSGDSKNLIAEATRHGMILAILRLGDRVTE